MQDQPSRRTDKTYAALFGRFTGTSEATPPANEVLVGREGQRAYLVDLLISMGRRGSYLITGRRGAGKTSFVQQCISEYRASVFKRFLRASVGRGVWDRFVVVVIWLTLIGGALMLSELLLLLVQMTRLSFAHHHLLWLLVLPLAILLMYPAVYAKELFEASLVTVRPFFFKGKHPPRTSGASETRFPSIASFYLVLILGIATWFLEPFGDPSLAVTRALTVISALYLFVQATSFYDVALEGKEIHRSWLLMTRRRRVVPTWNPLLLLYSPLAAIYILYGPAIDEPLPPNREYVANLGLCALILGLGLFLRFFHLRYAFVLRDPEPEELRHASRRGAQNYATAGFLMLLVGFAIWYYELREKHVSLMAWPMVAIACASTFFILRGGFRETSNTGTKTNAETVCFRAQPKYALCAKAALSIVVVVHLSHPIIAHMMYLARPVIEAAGELAMAPPILSPIREALYGGNSTDIAPAKPEEVQMGERESARSLNHLAATQYDDAVIVAGSMPRLFSDAYQQGSWSMGVLLSLFLFYFIEYEWIVRPGIGSREDRALDPAARELPERQEVCDRRNQWRCNRRLAELTFPWMMYRTWLPVLVTEVNLGFEKLDHRRVVQAMLVGLREKYYSTFLSWDCGLANLWRLLGVILVIVLATLTDDALFKLPNVGRRDVPAVSKPDSQPDGQAKSDSQPDEQTKPDGQPYEQAKPDGQPDEQNQSTERKNPICDAINAKRDVSTKFPNVICNLSGDWLLEVLYFNLVPSSFGKASEYLQGGEDLLFYGIVPYTAKPVEVASIAPEDQIELERRILLPAGPYFCIYHLLLVFMFLFSGRWVLISVPILPYRQNIRRIDDVLDSLSAYMRVTTRHSNLWQPAQWVHGFFTDEQERQTERAPVDPRTVELAFLRILEDIQKGGLRMPGSTHDHLSLPVPEITFVFDELDKLGTRADPESASPSAIAEEELEILHAEHRRSMTLMSLLSDLKNLLSSADARFIFVGGRNLYDEWLADQTARQPLLTNIFNAQIYLPSLMTDYDFAQPRKEMRGLDQRTTEYLAYQQRRARILYWRWARKRWRPSYGLSVHRRWPECFVQSPLSDEELAKPIRIKDVLDARTGVHVDTSDESAIEALMQDFARFLTYRSKGNPKKLKELFASFVRPIGRSISASVMRRALLPCRHVLQFGDAEIFRVQLLASVYWHFTLTFEERLTSRDDKLAISVFFLSDFLFKFHRRAFSWSNLERVDELVHIHRAPDLRDILSEIVDHSSERFLHRVLNGLYTFRFRSDMAREVEYLSRQSADEMAAFNFTLDESQSLKTFYAVALKNIKEGNPGLVAGLGELYEFDQEFDTARQHYKRAVDILDSNLEKQLTGSRGGGVRRILCGEPIAQQHARIFLKWGIVRLRLMLQTAMTFEHARNLERAHAQYRTTRSLARTLLRAYLDQEGRSEDRFRVTCLLSTLGDRDSRLHVLKNLNILFQPVFAEAWVSEKLIGGIDTSASLIERELFELRRILPFVREPKTEISTDPAKVQGSNFALITSQTHNKTGDLLFFKGRNRIPLSKMKEAVEAEITGKKHRSWEGYLLRCHYHYAVSLHELRRYLYHRVASSKHKFNIAKDPWATFLAQEWPDFIFRAAGNGMNDMAEATLARVSLFSLLRLIERGGECLKWKRGGLARVLVNNPALEQSDFIERCSKWLEPDTLVSLPNEELTLDGRSGLVLKLGTLQSWFGAWNENTDNHRDLVRFTDAHKPDERLVMSLNLCLVGARYFERGGYPEDAARELLQICETVTQYLWWSRMAENIRDHTGEFLAVIEKRPCKIRLERRARELKDNIHGLIEPQSFEGKARKFWVYLIDLALGALERASDLFRQSRRDEKLSGRGSGYYDDESNYIVGDTVPASVLTVACSLGLAGRDLVASKPVGEVSLEKRLRELLRGWTGQPVKASTEGSGQGQSLASHDALAKELRETLERSLVRHRYPMINRLKGLKVLIDDQILGDGDDWPAAIEWALELLEMKDKFAAPFHFTPFHSGVTFALISLMWEKKGGEAQGDTEERRRTIYRAAQRDLRTSEEMYTQRRAYYEAISDLFYLYDDFNDRQIHFNHAIQMAGSELGSLLRELLRVLPQPSPQKQKTSIPHQRGRERDRPAV